ncbi:MAG: hypothetical protein LAP39_15455 [Acidobacteriia bacterium]|nr:hypothetical protein [Terriglobia bacterium]
MIKFFSVLAIGFKLVGATATAVPLDGLLDRTGKRVEEFWDQFSAVSCTETVLQTKLGASGKVLVQRTSTFDYLIMLQLTGDDLTVDESRLPQGQPKKASDRPLLSTAGFSTLVLIFHPYFQSSYEFTPVALEDINGRKLQEVRFEHIQGRRTPAALQLRGRDYPLEWQGSAWIDPKTGYVSRIHAGLKTSMPDVGLRELWSDVRYVPVQFQSEKETAWLPEVAVIEAGTEHQRWRNVHQFARYRRFSVTTDTKTESPKQ